MNINENKVIYISTKELTGSRINWTLQIIII